jgi:hypothetical protein
MKMLDGWERGHPARRSHGIAPWKALRAGCPRSYFHGNEESAVLCSQEDKCRCFAEFALSEQTADPSLGPR